MTKHVSKFCGINRQLSRYDKSVMYAQVVGKVMKAQLTSQYARTKGAEKCWRTVRWMCTTPVEHNLVSMIEKYLLAQDTLTWTECLCGHSPILSVLAEVQDKLGWDNFLAGRISSVFLEAVKPYLCSNHRSRLTPAKWCQTLPSKSYN